MSGPDQDRAAHAVALLRFGGKQPAGNPNGAPSARLFVAVESPSVKQRNVARYRTRRLYWK